MKKLYMPLLLAAVFVVGIYAYNHRGYPDPDIGPLSSQEARDNIRSLPKEQCPCWVAVGQDQGCHPQQDCQ